MAPAPARRATAAGIVEVEVHIPAIGVTPELRKLTRLAAASDIANERVLLR